MRIADVLREQDDGDNPLPPFTSKSHCSSPTAAGSSSCRSLLSKWFHNRRKRAPATSGGERVVHRSAADGILIGRVDSCGRLPEIDLSSGVRPPNEVAFNLGMGIGMAFLLAGNSNEMKKMVELRNQMEMLLKEIKAEVQRRDDSSLQTSSDVSEDAISTTISTEQNSSSSDMEETKHFTQFNSKDDQSTNKLRDMDQLEVELQVELDRMELNFEGGVVGKHLIEMNSKELDLSSGSSSASAWYDHMPDENSEQHHGICAYDLERRLHELLQTRQQERIEALESALELAQRELHEKEDELCYWKKIGGLIPENEETYFSLSFK